MAILLGVPTLSFAYQLSPSFDALVGTRHAGALSSDEATRLGRYACLTVVFLEQAKGGLKEQIFPTSSLRNLRNIRANGRISMATVGSYEKIDYYLQAQWLSDPKMLTDYCAANPQFAEMHLKSEQTLAEEFLQGHPSYEIATDYVEWQRCLYDNLTASEGDHQCFPLVAAPSDGEVEV